MAPDAAQGTDLGESQSPRQERRRQGGIPPGTVAVIAAFNEGEKIAAVVEELRQRIPSVVVVDDGSGDDTGARAREAGAQVLRHLVNRGQGAALQTGIDWALRHGAAYIVTFDADGQHRPEDLGHLLTPVAEDRVDVTLGSRFLGSAEGMPWRRRLLLKGAVVFTRLTSGLRLTDTHNGLRALSREAASQIHLRLDRMAHASELLDEIARLRLRYEEVPVQVRYTDYSRGKGQSSLAAVKVALDYLLNRLLG